MASVAKTSVFAMLKMLLTLLVIGTFGNVVQASDAPLGERAATLKAANAGAQSFTQETNGIGVAISFGTGNTGTAVDLGDAFVKEIKRRGVDAKFYYSQETHDGVGMTFFVGELTIGQWPPDFAASNISHLIEKAENQQRIAFLEARMANTRKVLIEKYGENYVEGMEERWLDGEGKD